MRSKLLMGALVVIGVAALAGVGFASYTTSATATLNATAGSFYLWQSPVVGASSLSSVSGSCAPGAAGTSITLTASNLLPGDFCNFTVTVTDPGSVGGNWIGYLSSCSGPCTQLSTGAGNVGTFVTLAPFSGNSDVYYFLVKDTGSGTVAESDSWVIPITGTPV